MNKYTVACLLATSFSICLSVFTVVQARSDLDYEAEILQYIIDPCFKYSAGKSEPVAQMSESEMVTLMKLMSPDAVQDTIDVTLPVVRGKPVADRMKVYEIGLRLCIQGTGK